MAANKEEDPTAKYLFEIYATGKHDKKTFVGDALWRIENKLRQTHQIYRFDWDQSILEIKSLSNAYDSAKNQFFAVGKDLIAFILTIFRKFCHKLGRYLEFGLN